jgi:hypothetical protein
MTHIRHDVVSLSVSSLVENEQNKTNGQIVFATLLLAPPNCFAFNFLTLQLAGSNCPFLCPFLLHKCLAME